MALWVQLRDHDDDVEFPDTATYDIHVGGVLAVTSATDVHLFSPGYWEHVTIGARHAVADADHDAADARWQ